MDNLHGFDIIFPREYMRAALVVSLLSVWVLVALFYYLNRYTKRYYFTIWTAAWLFYALWLTMGMTFPNSSLSSVVAILRQCCISYAVFCLKKKKVTFLVIRTPQTLLCLFIAFFLTLSS